MGRTEVAIGAIAVVALGMWFAGGNGASDPPQDANVPKGAEDGTEIASAA